MNPDSFQSVVDHTVDDGRQFLMPAEFFPQKKPLAVAYETKNLNTMTQWHDMVRQEYARQKEQAATPSRSPAPRPAASRREDEDASVGVGSSDAVELTPQAVKAQLESSINQKRGRIARFLSSIEQLTEEVAELEADVQKLQLMLEVLDAPQGGRQAGSYLDRQSTVDESESE